MVFPIFKQDNDNPSKYYFKGNGFFIDSKGVFVTAAHVLREKSNYFVGIPDSTKNYNMLKIQRYACCGRDPYYKKNGDYERGIPRDRKKHQYGPEYKDVALGFIEIENVKYLSFARKRPFEYHNLYADYYERSVHFPIDGKFIDNNIIEKNDLNKVHVDFNFTNRLWPAAIPYMGNFDPQNVNEYDKYSNCLWLNGKTIGGTSGSPVLNQNNNIVGMVVGGVKAEEVTTILLSKYIMKKICCLKKKLLSL